MGDTGRIGVGETRENRSRGRESALILPQIAPTNVGDYRWIKT